MEKFMLIFQGSMSRNESPEQFQKIMEKWMAWIKKLRNSEQYVSGEPLLPGGKLILKKGGPATDGPYTEGKEVVGGYFIIRANDYDEAVKICDDYPGFDYGGSVQVRQVVKLEVPA